MFACRKKKVSRIGGVRFDSAGCFWLRLSGFSAADAENLGGGGVAAAGPLEVVIAATDAGFAIDDDCGTWTRVSGVAAR